MKKSSTLTLFIALSCTDAVIGMICKGTAGILFGISAVIFAITAAFLIFSKKENHS